MKKTPNINPESQDVAELQAMVKALMASENQLKQERQYLYHQVNITKKPCTLIKPKNILINQHCETVIQKGRCQVV